MAWSVRPGSRSAIWNQRWPSSCTLCVMMASSALVHPTRSGLRLSSAFTRASPLLMAVHTWFFLSWPHLEHRYVPAPPPPPPVLAGTVPSPSAASPRARPEASASLSRLYLLRTASSERPGSIAAICRHLHPICCTPCQISWSSRTAHSLRLLSDASLAPVPLPLPLAPLPPSPPPPSAPSTEGAPPEAPGLSWVALEAAHFLLLYAFASLPRGTGALCVCVRLGGRPPSLGTAPPGERASRTGESGPPTGLPFTGTGSRGSSTGLW